MRNNFHYGFGTRLTAVILTLLMVLSLGGFVLRDTGMGVDEPMIFDESYGTPAPEATEVPAEATEAPAETAAPEATNAPAEDTPAPEATEAPAEATPVPETDSGTDTNINTSEPEPTADPQDTPAPEGDMPADEPMTVEAAEPKVKIVVNHTGAGNNDNAFEMVITSTNYSGSEDQHLIFEFQDTGSDKGSTHRAYVTSVDPENSRDTTAEGNPLPSENCIYIKTSSFHEGQNEVKIKFTFGKDSTLSDTVSFRVKYKGAFKDFAGWGGDGAEIIYYYDTATGKLTYKAASHEDYTTGALSNEKDTGNTIPGGDDLKEHLTGKYNIVYHLNPPDGTEEPAGYQDGFYVDSGDSSVTLKSIGWAVEERNATMFSSNAHSALLGHSAYARDASADNYNNKADWYFAGWSKTKGYSFATSGYESIDYPVTMVTQGTTVYRGYATAPVLSGTEVFTKTESLDGGGEAHYVELYAVWVERDMSGLFGYSMAIKNAGFSGANVANGPVKVADQLLGDNGLSGGGAQKYTVLDAKQGATMTTPNEDKMLLIIGTEPVNNSKEYTFIGWFNKKPGDSKRFLLKQGDTFQFSTTESGPGKIYSLDALWGHISPAIGGEYYYDASQRTITFDNEDNRAIPAVQLTSRDTYDDDKYPGANNALRSIKNAPAIYRYTVTKKAGSGDSWTDVQRDVESKPQVTGPGIYRYEVSATLDVPEEVYTGISGTNSVKLPIETTSATLTIYPKLTLTVKKDLTGADKAGAPDSFLFTVACISSAGVENVVDAGRAAFDFTKDVTVQSNDSVPLEMWFTKPGTYTITVTEKEEGVPGVTYDENLSQTFTVTVGDDYHITNSDDGVTADDIGNATATATFTNTYQTGSLTVTKKVDGYVEDGKAFTFTVTLKNGETPVSGTFGEGENIAYFDSNGKTTFNLAKDESWTLKGLPAGVNYTVEEDKEENFAAIEPSSGTIVANETVQVTVTNTRNTGSLKVTKIVYHEPGSHTDDGYTTDGPFTFTVTPKDSSVNVNLTKVTATEVGRCML